MTKKKLDQVAYEYIVDRIETGQLFEREHITEQTVADELNISRTPVRKAFDRLVVDDYLENISNVGVRVKKQELTSTDLRYRFDFFERLVNHYLFDLEKKEIIFDVTDLQEQLESMTHSVDAQQTGYEQSEFKYWRILLHYESNTYSQKMLLTTIRECLYLSGYLQEIMLKSRSLKLKHYGQIADYLQAEDYAYARREIRILINQLKMNVIETGQVN